VTGRRRDEGFTLIELMTAMALLGILLAIAVGPWRSYQTTRQHREAAREAVAALRNAQVSAVSESVRYRVAVTDSGRALSVYRSPVSGAEVLRVTLRSPNSKVSFGAATFTTTSGASTSVYFYPRGSASSGSLKVQRAGRNSYTIDVEGLTGRVSLQG
jgi:general secretion pathway protein H